MRAHRQGAWTVDDLGRLPRELRYELVDGWVITLSPTAVHQDLCMAVWQAVRAECPASHVVSWGLSLSVDGRNEPRPDVVVIRPDHCDRSPVPVEDAILVVEVISPDSTFRDMYDKAHVYAKAGVATYWVVDPLHEHITLTEMLLAKTGEYEFGEYTTDVFTTDRPWPVTLDLPALTKRRAALLERAGGEEK